MAKNDTTAGNPLGPIPRPTLDDQGFWEAANRGQLVMQRCSDCAAYRHLPRPMCPKCNSMRWEWAEVSGRGTVHSFTIVHHPLIPSLRDLTPYDIVLVELEEGPRIISNMVDTPHEDVHIGMPVVVTFQRVSEEIALPKFKRA
jgi:uncharacterized OB-fold protein